MVLRVVQEVVPEEVVQAWEVLVSEKEPIAGELAAVQQQMSHQKETLPYAVSVMAFLLQNHPPPLKIPLLLFSSLLRDFLTCHSKHHGLKRSQLLHVFLFLP